MGEVTTTRAVGPGRVLAVAYGFFTLAAGARSGVQLATHFDEAPLAYLLSAAAALIYLTATILILRVEADPTPQRVALARRLCFVELGGVLLVGLTSVILPASFPDATVWSLFGSGYAFVPAALPVLALLWLHRAEHPAAESAAGPE
ncbi:hypothetical protein SAMN05892883_0538 [Jatrophihabitans sp. GAS493]|uniref:hypothetical protein n=1 Tax=Jatrophihabitans sp. GAS493 TaxID=1907575 RepID=UPI000BB8F112|nr:hypothetical protein [Jatrophihabitans sp. GAS493]SOD70908.1 hypothetical protein SAMN05892883_0538 [Jatrophihabitans sp. GAS493]